ncbi:Deoxyribodipyrimidine photo-lyase-related protein [Marinobacter sp. LV10R510-11A]|nr:Deoxyribodipyrimidine photo-lyase-related protein [Marinobacter sp. LV10R510-11A]
MPLRAKSACRRSALKGADRERDRIVMAEVHEEANYTNHHTKKG